MLQTARRFVAVLITDLLVWFALLVAGYFAFYGTADNGNPPHGDALAAFKVGFWIMYLAAVVLAAVGGWWVAARTRTGLLVRGSALLVALLVIAMTSRVLLLFFSGANDCVLGDAFPIDVVGCD